MRVHFLLIVNRSLYFGVVCGEPIAMRDSYDFSAGRRGPVISSEGKTQVAREIGDRLILSFWDLCLDNLPPGRFERRTIDAAEARALIDAAREAGALCCASDTDLLAPFEAAKNRRHAQLRAVLKEIYEITLSFDDFLSGSDAQIVTPLNVVSLRQPGDKMLIVSCGYVFAKNPRSDDLDDRLVIDESSVRFELITAT